jgi:ferrous iron transport protein A
MTLVDLNKNQKAIIKKIDATPDLKQRLLSLGIVRGAEVEVVDYSINKSTVEIKVGNTLVALRDSEAKKIEVEEI